MHQPVFLGGKVMLGFYGLWEKDDTNQADHHTAERPPARRHPAPAVAPATQAVMERRSLACSAPPRLG